MKILSDKTFPRSSWEMPLMHDDGIRRVGSLVRALALALALVLLVSTSSRELLRAAARGKNLVSSRRIVTLHRLRSPQSCVLQRPCTKYVRVSRAGVPSMDFWSRSFCRSCDASQLGLCAFRFPRVLDTQLSERPNDRDRGRAFPMAALGPSSTSYALTKSPWSAFCFSFFFLFLLSLRPARGVGNSAVSSRGQLGLRKRKVERKYGYFLAPGTTKRSEI